MRQKTTRWFLVLAATTACVALLASCGNERRIVSLQVMPADAVLSGVGSRVQFKALASYSRTIPGNTMPLDDVSSRSSWKIDPPSLATISNTGLATVTGLCGTGHVMASIYSDPRNPASGSLVVGTPTVKGMDEGTPDCP